MSREPIIAIALLTQVELQALRSLFDRAWPINDAPCFQGLLQAIDEATGSCGAREMPLRSARRLSP